jgi:phosphatidylserine/phosphatidylglycerophosphate/cardiolipin synthase-like enzyme
MHHKPSFLSKFLIVGLVVLVAPMAVVEAQPLNKTAAVLISAVYPNGYQTGGRDEAFQLMNVGPQEIDITGWSITNNKTTITFPGVALASGEKIWCSRTAIAFEEEFGVPPDFEYGENSNTDVRGMTGNPLNLIKVGGELVLLNAAGIIVDTMVYGTGNVEQPGWKGDSVKPYSAGRAKGQILYRKLDQATGWPVPDTDTVADWAQDPNDPINGRKVMYPGWNLDEYFQTAKVPETANLTILVTPDNAYEPIRKQIESAKHSIYIEVYTFEHAALAEIIAAKARAGVDVRILLEGGLRTTGITDQEKWCCQQVEMTGGRVYFVAQNPDDRIYARYGNQHAKFIIIDNRTLIMGSDNLGYGSIPDDQKKDGTRGRRGVMLIIDAPTLVAYARQIFDADFNTNFKDILHFQANDEKYGAPPSDFTPDRVSGGTVYTILKAEPLELRGTFDFEIVQSPENSLRDQDGLLGLVAKAGEGDVILVEQQYERKYWGPKDSSPEADPNPRLEAYIAAARRGATVRILLDNCYASISDPKGSVATCEYVNNIARTEDLQLEALLGNPAGGGVFEEIIAGRDYEGIHNKMILVRINGQGYAHIGSINGSEVSSKVNRELAVQIRSDEVYNYLSDIFEYDWSVSELPIEIPGWH